MAFEEFKKYAEPDCYERISCPTDSGDGCGACEGLRKDGWTTALEFIRGLYKKYDLEDWDNVAWNIKRDIKKELEE